MTAEPPRILVAERSPTVGLAIVAWLRSWGMRAELARTADAAHAALAAASFDLVIADSALPPLDTAGTPQLALLAPSRSAGPTPALARPVQPDALRAAVEAALAGTHRRQPGPDLAAIAELWESPSSPAFRRVAAVFLAEAPERVAGIVTAHAAADRPRLCHEAHALAGAALNVGLPDITRLARAIEHAPAATPLADLAPQILALQDAAARDFDALQRVAGLA